VSQVPTSLAGLLSLLAGCFTQPTFQTFGMLVVGSYAFRSRAAWEAVSGGVLGVG
jgi:hypothetical protein